MASNTSTADYKYQFVSEPDDALKCLICLEVAEEPWQHGKCARLFCKKCLEQHGEDKPCPNCQREQPQYFEDGKSKKEIKALPVKCDNIERKCEWVGTVGTLKEHVATCEFALLPCPKKCKDDSNKVKYVMRKDLDKHLKESCPNRDDECKHCGGKGTYATVYYHDQTCEKKVIKCPSVGCSEKMQRQHIQKHVDTVCKHAFISCKFVSIGCKKKFKRQDMAAHEEDAEVHLHMALDTIDLLKEICFTLNNGEHMGFKFTDYQKRKNNNECVQSPTYYINGYHMAIEVYANEVGNGEGTHVSVFAPILKGRYDAEPKWPFIGKITFILLNQLEDKNHYQMIMYLTAANNARAGGPRWGQRQFIPHSELGHNPVKNTQYLKDDTLYLRMSVEVADYDSKPWLKLVGQ